MYPKSEAPGTTAEVGEVGKKDCPCANKIRILHYSFPPPPPVKNCSLNKFACSFLPLSQILALGNYK